MDLNKKNVKTILLIAFACICAFTLMQNIAQTIAYAKWFLLMLKPVLTGFILALMLGVPLKAFEEGVFAEVKSPAVKRIASLLSAILALIVLVCFVLFMIIPSLIETVNVLASRVPPFIQSAQLGIIGLMDKYPDLESQIELLGINIPEQTAKALTWLTAASTNFISFGLSIAGNIVNSMVNIFLGLVIAIHALLSKEKLAVQFKGLAYAFLPYETAEKTISIASLANVAYSGYLAGQSIDALIQFAMTFVIMIILNLPSLALMFASMVGISTFIPMIGSILSMAIGAFIMAVVYPSKVFLFLVLYLLMQNIETNILYPRIVGTQVGLPPLWTLIAVLVGANMFGILGIIFFVPLASILYTMLKSKVYYTLIDKGLPAEKLISQSQTGAKLTGNTPIDEVFSKPVMEKRIKAKPIFPPGKILKSNAKKAENSKKDDS